MSDHFYPNWSEKHAIQS